MGAYFLGVKARALCVYALSKTVLHQAHEEGERGRGKGERGEEIGG
jgi:hypothetical protein